MIPVSDSPNNFSIPPINTWRSESTRSTFCVTIWISYALSSLHYVFGWSALPCQEFVVVPFISHLLHQDTNPTVLRTKFLSRNLFRLHKTKKIRYNPPNIQTDIIYWLKSSLLFLCSLLLQQEVVSIQSKHLFKTCSLPTFLDLGVNHSYFCFKKELNIS